MNETLAAIASRYSCRAYSDVPVSTDVLRAIVEAGLHAPSAMNRQPWRIVVIPTKAQVDEINAAGLSTLQSNDPAGYERIQSRGGFLLYHAPAMIIIATQAGKSHYATLDAGIVASHIALAATSLGVNSCVVAMSRNAFTGPQGEELKKKYIPEGFEFSVSILLGYADGDPGTSHVIDPDKAIWL